MSQDLYQAKVHLGHPQRPIVFAFHGTGGSEDQFFDLARGIAPQSTIICPRGDVSEMGQLRYFRRTGEGIYDMANLAIRTDRMADFIEAHRQDYPDAPVFGFGYSNGANILASVLMKRPDLFDRVGLLHPLIPWAPAAIDLSGKEILITAGQTDPICPWPQSEALMDWVTACGGTLHTSVHPGGHDLHQDEITALTSLLTD